MLFGLLVEQIKTESRVKTDDTFDAVVVALINELFKEAVEGQRPFELKAETTLNATITTGITDLPTTFFLHHKVYFRDADTEREWQLVDQDDNFEPAPRGMYGHPKTFEILSDNKISLKPPGAIVGGDTINLVYYKAPPIVDLETMDITENPIPRLEPFLVRAAVRRIRMLHVDDIQVAQMFTGDIASAASGYAKAEPPEEE